jgi:hypothetical protein
MPRANFVGSTVLLLLCLCIATPSSAQQTFNPSSIVPNPLVEQMLRAAPDGEQIVELKGYVGPSTADTVRLYADLMLSRYIEIPRNAIVNMVQEGDPKTGLVKLYVRSSATVVVASRFSVNAGSLSLRASALPGARPRNAVGCLLYGIECLAGNVLACAASAGCIEGMTP